MAEPWSLLILTFLCSFTLTSCKLTNEVSFFGESFLLNPLRETSSSSWIKLDFYTHMSQGLLFLAAGGTDYILIQLSGGTLEVRVNLGHGEAVAHSARGVSLNNFQWHSVALNRTKDKVYLVVDGSDQVEMVVPGLDHNLDINLGVYVGGTGLLRTDLGSYSKSFRGCMREVYYNGQNILQNMKSLKNSNNIVWHCADEFKVTSLRPISFNHYSSYVAFPHFRMDSNHQGLISFEFKTRSKNSVFLFNSGVGKTFQNFIAVELIDGKPKLSLRLDSDTVEVVTQLVANDGRWHHLEVLLSQTLVQLSIDGNKNTSPLSIHSNINLGGHLFIGGLGPKSQQHALQLGLMSHEDNTKKSMLGCVRNLQVNSFNYNYHHIQISRQISTDCAWDFPCASDPCVLNAQCTELSGSDFKCDCGEDICVRKEFQLDANLKLENLVGFITAGNLMVKEKTSALVGTNVIKINKDVLRSSVREESIVFFVKERPSEGFIDIKGKSHQDTFTIKDLNENTVYYRHLGGKVKQDSITFQVSFTVLTKEPGSTSEHFNFVLPVTIVSSPNLEVSLKSGQILNITSGAILRITPSILNVKSSGIDPTLLRFSVVFLRPSPSSFESSEAQKKQILSFLLKDVQDGKIWFRHKDDSIVYTKVNVTDGVSISNAVDLRFKVEELKLIVRNNTGININYGAHYLMTANNLSTTTNVPLEELEVRYNITKPPTQGSIQRLEYSTSQWSNVTTFTQRHIDAGRIRYLHLPGKSIAMLDNFTFEVVAKHQKTEPQVFRITFKPVTLTIEQNYNLILYNVPYGKLTNRTLLVVSGSPDFKANNMEYTLVRAPQFGTLYLIKQHVSTNIPFEEYQSLQLEGSFTQQDINSGFVYYKIDKPTFERKTDYADLHASYFGFNIMVRAMFEFSPKQLTARLINNGLKDVPEGGSATITGNDLSLEIDSYKQFKFWVITGPKHGSINIQDPASSTISQHNVTSFTMSDILNGRVIYSHDDSENGADSFTFLVNPQIEDSDLDAAGEFQELSGTFKIIMKMNNDNSPIRSVNKVFHIATDQTKLLSIDDLAFRDPDIDFDDSKLAYQLQPIPNGEIINVMSKELVLNFTQSDLKEGKLVFKHKGETYARIPISVSDGKFFTSSLFVVQASPPYIKVVNNTGVEVKQGASAAISSFNLSLETNLNLNPETIIFRVVEAPKYGIIRIDGRNTNDFKYQDLIKAKVRYWHNGGNSREDKVIFTVQLESLRIQVPFSLKITADGVSDPPEIIHNQILKVTAMQSETITENHLNVAHKNYPPHEIEFIITQLPRSGHLVIKGNPVKTGSAPEFSQQDIIEGQVVYVSDTSDALSDKLVFDVGTEFQSLRQLDFLIEIVPQTLQMNRVNAKVREGGTLVLGSSLLLFKPQLPISSKAALSLYQIPVHGKVMLRNGQTENQVNAFTYEDVSRGRLVYVHDNSESLSDELAIRLEHQEGKLPGRMIVVLIEVTPVDDQPPFVVTNAGLDLWTGSLQLLTNKQLMATDPDTSSDHIEFRVSAPSNGHIAYLNNTFKQITKFTQRDLDSGSIVFVHKGSETGTFTFQATDGINADQSRVFRVRARPVELSVITNNTIRVFPGFTQPITNVSILVKTSSSNFTHPILFSLLDTWPRKGKLVTIVNQKPVEISTFTQSDINEGKIFYKHTAETKSWIDTDVIYFEISTAYAQALVSKALKVEISFSHINQDNYRQLLHIKPLNIIEGGKITINKDYLDSTEFIAKIRAFLPVVDVEFSFAVPPRQGYLWFDGQQAAVNQKFTQEDLNKGDLTYKHDNTETVKDRFKFAVKLIVPKAYGGYTNSEQIFTMDIFIEPVNDRGFELITIHPRITVKQGSQVVITPSNLTTIDMDTGPEEIKYTIVTQPSNGMVVKLPDNRTRISSFSQKDINDENIMFRHDGTRKSSDSLYFKVWDGLFDPHFSNMNILVILLNINVAKDSFVPLIQGNKSVTVTSKHLKVSTNGDYNSLIYKIIQRPQFGRLMKLNTPAVEFSQGDLDKGYIFYNQNADSPGDDYFTCSIRLKNMDSFHDEIGFDVTMMPLLKQNPLVTSAGSFVAITRSTLDASELAHMTNDNPRFTISKYPKYGKIMRRHRQRREANLENHFQSVTSFTFEDVVYTQIYYVPNDDTNHNGSDSLVFVLSARGVPSAKGELKIQLNEPTIVPNRPTHTDVEKTTPIDDSHQESQGDSGSKNVSQEAVVESGVSLDDDNNGVVIGTVLSLILIICVAVVLIVLYLRWRRRNQPMSLHQAKAAKPRPYISGPLQLEQPNVHIEPHDGGLSSPMSRESTALMSGSHGAESEYMNTTDMANSGETDSLHQLTKDSDGSLNIMKVDVSYTMPGRRTALGKDTESASEELDRPSTRASGRESNASTDLMDWSLMEPDLLQHCRTTTPILSYNQYWL
uniref:Laminin G domain-containing protein n=1 Tax=Biomphalaria glabrata TaxID=6526 RepID=A0A2C9K2C2_BIOGL